MSWAIGYDDNHKRDVGYGVPAICDHPNCEAKINRGLSYVCGGEPYGDDDGCGLFFCGDHLAFYGDHKPQQCERCGNPDDPEDAKPFDPKPDTQGWIDWKLIDASWEDWRKENPEFVAKHARTLPSNTGETD